MHMRRLITITALLVTCTAPAWAQGVKLEFHDGLVTLSAQNVPVRTILSEWARLGGTRVVNAERVPGGLLTIEMNNVPERQALDALLRNASGYIAGPKPLGQGGASSYASILIMPVSSGPAPAPPPPQAFTQPAQFPRPVQRVAPPADPDDEPSDLPPVEGLPPQGTPQRAAPQRFFNRGGAPNNVGPRPPVRSTAPNDDDDEPPPPPSTTPTAANPFGVNVGSSQPGVISPVPPPTPQQPAPPQPRPRVDPEP